MSTSRWETWVHRTLRGALFLIPACAPWTVAGAHLAAGLAAACGILWCARRRAWSQLRTPSDLGMLAVAVAVLLATLTSPQRLESFINARKLLLLPMLSLGPLAWASMSQARTALRVSIATLAISAFVAATWFLMTPHPPDARLRANGHYMTFAGLLLLAFPPAAAAACATGGRARLWYGLAALVLACGLLLTFTRGAWIGACVAVIAMLARRRPQALIVVPVAVAVLLAILPPAYRARALSSFDPHHVHNVERVHLWRAGVAMFRDRPWTGFGWIDLGPQVQQYRAAGAPPIAHGHLHGNWIHVLASFGMIGGIAFLLLTLGQGNIAWRAARPGLDREAFALGSGVLGSFLGFHVMGLFEWNLGDAEVTMTLYAMLGAAAAVGRNPMPVTAVQSGQEPAGPGRGGA